MQGLVVEPGEHRVGLVELVAGPGEVSADRAQLVPRLNAALQSLAVSCWSAYAPAGLRPVLDPVPCQNPACSSDLLVYARRSCSSASLICSWSGCSAGWRS